MRAKDNHLLEAMFTFLFGCRDAALIVLALLAPPSIVRCGVARLAALARLPARHSARCRSLARWEVQAIEQWLVSYLIYLIDYLIDMATCERSCGASILRILLREGTCYIQPLLLLPPRSVVGFLLWPIPCTSGRLACCEEMALVAPRVLSPAWIIPSQSW